MPRTSRQRLGSAAEQRAADLLVQAGLAIVDRNWRCRAGELDLVAHDGPVLVFVEVRARTRDACGGARASITPAKQARLLRCAQHYLQHRGGPPPPCRFDLVLFQAGALEWMRNAFDAPSDETG